MKRRSFLKVFGSAAGGLAVGVNSILGRPEPVVSVQSNGMPLRILGRTGLKVSIIGYPGFALRQDPQDQCTESVRRALERGINYLDVAPAYADGECEKKLGVALEGVDRKSYYLACKTKKRDKEGCRQELERSLTRLKTDYFDVYQLHHLVRPEEDVKAALAPGGAMEAVLEAKKAGKVRFIGFSAHTTKAAIAALKAFPFDTVMFPINYVEYFNRNFGKEVIELAGEKGAAVLAIKPMNAGAPKPGEKLVHKWWYRTTEEQADTNMAWRFSLSLPTVVTGFPPAWLDLTDRAIQAGYAYKPISEDDTKALQKAAEGQGSIFKREEDAVATHGSFESPYPHRAHECDYDLWA
jgi:predicted aldo/keto reductase-like oxidoreductase